MLRRPRAVLITTASLAAVAVTATAVLFGAGLIAGPPLSTVGRVEFTTPLAVPPLAPSTVDADGTRVFELEAAAGETEFAPGVRTATWGFRSGDTGAAYLGPTLRAADGERVRVRIRNSLAETTTVHWHGMHLPAAMDGGPHQPIAPGGSWEPEWRIDQDAATLWYHPHPHGATEEHVARGLAGLFLLDDAEEAALPLPRDYGVDDIPLIVQDARLGDDGALQLGGGGFVGALGDRLLVNGTVGPYLDVTTEVVRLRLVNASTARIYSFALDDGRALTQIASDGGLLEGPVELDRVRLSPGERAEVLVRMTPGERLVLRSVPSDLGATSPFGGSNGGGDAFDVLELRAAATLAARGTIPDALVPIERLDPDDATADRRLVFDGTLIDDLEMDLARVDHVVQLGATEVWTVRNDMSQPHNFHIHDVRFQVVDVAGAPPPPELRGWKDTVYLPPQQEVRLVMRFEDHADPRHAYMYHCHLLRHEDQGMMGQFVVVEPGQKPDIMGSDHDH